MGKRGRSRCGLVTIALVIVMMAVLIPWPVGAEPDWPVPPESLTAVPASDHVDLSWTAPSIPRGGPITEYRITRWIEHYIDAPSLIEYEKSTFTVEGSIYAYRDQDVRGELGHRYFLTAVNSAGESAPGPAVIVWPGRTTPTAPEQLEAITHMDSAELEWLRPLHQGGTMVTSYNIYRGTDPANLTLVAALEWFKDYSDGDIYRPTARYTDEGLEPGLHYYYRVSAVNSFGESTLSKTIEISPRPGPLNVSVDPRWYNTPQGDVNVTWRLPDNSNISAFRIYLQGSLPITLANTTTSYHVENLTGFGGAVIRVSAVYGDGVEIFGDAAFVGFPMYEGFYGPLDIAILLLPAVALIVAVLAIVLYIRGRRGKT